jgi:hypothetical protein
MLIGILCIENYWYLAQDIFTNGEVAWAILDCPLNGFPCYSDAVNYRHDQYGI